MAEQASDAGRSEVGGLSDDANRVALRPCPGNGDVTVGACGGELFFQLPKAPRCLVHLEERVDVAHGGNDNANAVAIYLKRVYVSL